MGLARAARLWTVTVLWVALMRKCESHSQLWGPLNSSAAAADWMFCGRLDASARLSRISPTLPGKPRLRQVLSTATLLAHLASRDRLEQAEAVLSHCPRLGIGSWRTLFIDMHALLSLERSRNLPVTERSRRQHTIRAGGTARHFGTQLRRAWP